MACSFVFGAPCQLGSLAGLEHGRTIPFSDIGALVLAELFVTRSGQYAAFGWA